MAKTVGKKKPFKATPATKRRSRGDTVKQIALGTELKPRQVKEVFDGQKFQPADHRHHALVSRCSGKLSECLARFLTYRDSRLAALCHQPGEPIVVPLARHNHLVKTPPAGFERLLHRMDAVENFHKG